MRRELYYADTPVQVLNAIVMANMNTDEDANYNSQKDLLICTQFHHARDIVKRVEMAKVFESVYTVPPDSSTSRNKQRIRYIRDYCVSNRILNRIVESEYPDLVENRYDRIYCSIVTYVVLELIRYFHIQDVVLFEDGTGSYNNAIFDGLLTIDNFNDEVYPVRYSVKLVRKAIRHISKNQSHYKIVKRYLYRPEVAIGGVAPLDKLVFSSAANKAANIVWPSEKIGGSVETLNIMLLLQQFWTRDESCKKTEELIKVLNDNQIDYIARVHPRSKAIPSNLLPERCDIGEQLWELLCLEGKIQSETILIGALSSAQLTPWLLAGQVPYLIVIHPCMLGKDVRSTRLIASSIKELLDKYPNKDKVAIVRNASEVVAAITQFTSVG